jgi:hypothetical protein
LSSFIFFHVKGVQDEGSSHVKVYNVCGWFSWQLGFVSMEVAGRFGITYPKLLSEARSWILTLDLRLLEWLMPATCSGRCKPQ